MKKIIIITLLVILCVSALLGFKLLNQNKSIDNRPDAYLPNTPPEPQELYYHATSSTYITYRGNLTESIIKVPEKWFVDQKGFGVPTITNYAKQDVSLGKGGFSPGDDKISFWESTTSPQEPGSSDYPTTWSTSTSGVMHGYAFIRWDAGYGNNKLLRSYSFILPQGVYFDAFQIGGEGANFDEFEEIVRSLEIRKK